MKSNIYIESIEPFVANNLYDCTLYQVEKDPMFAILSVSPLADSEIV